MCRFGLIGHPIGHSLSPRLFAAAYGGRWPYELIDTDDFDAAFDIFIKGYDAVNVTAPFKVQAAMRADWRSPEVERIGAANILIRRDDGYIAAFNSDYLGVRALLSERLAAIPLEGVQGVGQTDKSIAIIGFGGAGKAAYAAAQDLFQDVRLYRHDGISDGVEADIVIYTLPRAVPGTDRIRCRILMEANYKDPCLAGRGGYEYIPGTAWHLAQALAGYELMTGVLPDREAMSEIYGK